MNNITTFIIALMTLLECKKEIRLEDFANKNGFTLEEVIEFLRTINKSRFCYDSQIDLNLSYQGVEVVLLEDMKETLSDTDDNLEEKTLEITFEQLKANVEKYKDIKLMIEDIDREKLNTVMNIFLKLDVEEELELYNIVNNKEIEDMEAATIIKDLLYDDCKNKFEALKDREVIKMPNINIKDNMNKIICLYDLIEDYNEKGNIANIINKNGNITTSVKLMRVYYDLDAHTWKFEFLRKGNKESIRLDSLNDDIDDSIEISNTINISKEKVRIVNNKVKLRVFHEENAKEKALRYCVKYNMELDVKNEYTDITINVQDDEKFLRWVRTMIPSVVILEPEKLRERMITEIKEWDKVYK